MNKYNFNDKTETNLTLFLTILYMYYKIYYSINIH